jgi:hypothetical protein
MYTKRVTFEFCLFYFSNAYLLMNKTLRWISALLLLLFAGYFQQVSAQSVARRWNELMLQAIREDFARPPVQARNLFHVSLAMYDAWAAYDTTAEAFFLGKTWGGYYCQFEGVPVPADIEAARRKAMSYAAYRLLVRRFQFSPNAFLSISRFNTYMAELGYDTNNFSTDYASGDPAALGNYIGFCLIFFSQQDGSNEQANYAITNYTPVNPPLDMAIPGNATMLDANHWQPLNLPGAIDQNGNPIPAIQRFQSPEWGRVVPFAMTPADKDTFTRNNVNWYVYNDPGPPPMLDTTANGDPSDAFKWNNAMVIAWNAHLDPTDSVLWDISPGALGNNQTPLPTTLAEYQTFYDFKNGGMPGATGHALNPITGQPYAPQVVPRGDYTRVLAQFWADGPNSETPPGHWFAIFNKVMDHPAFVRKFNGKGAELDSLEYDAKAYFVLGGAVHDAAISAWGIKGWYDNGRPVTSLRYMAGKGQSSDPGLPHYHPAGVQLIPGLIELVAAGDTLAGVNGQNIGKIKFYTWRGFTHIGNPATDFAGVGWILAESWWPFQRKTFVTPPFGGYISGHSTYSRSAAEALTLLTGDAYFPGGMGEFHIAANSNFLGLEKGPSVDVTLQWATYRDASDQTSLSRIWGSIHPPVDDIPGRIIGAKCGIGSYNLAKELFYNDLDQDGFYSYEDCNDYNAAIFPGATEICDGIDNDCDGSFDNNLTITTYYVDFDSDGYGSDVAPIDTCLLAAPVGYATNGLDCDDTNAAIHPGALETCDDLDNDCNGMADDGLPVYTFYPDGDGDGFGGTSTPLSTCFSALPQGYADNNLDCDDANAAINPAAVEMCDTIDNNCNGIADEGLPLFTYYLDQDGDQFGSTDAIVTTCAGLLPGFADNSEDCNDLDASVYPGAPELCDDVDNNCDNVADEGLPIFTYYSDGDGDGFGNPSISFASCLFPTPISFVLNGLDCDDDNPEVNPGIAEIYGDGIDNDCNGVIDSVSSTRNPALRALAFPNPVHEILTIKVDFEGPMYFELSNANGQVVNNGEILFSGGITTLSFEQQLPGVYILRMFVPTENNLILLRVVKM